MPDKPPAADGERRRDLVVALGARWWEAMLLGRKRFEVRRRWVARDRYEGQRCWVYSGGGIAGWFVAGEAREMSVAAVRSLDGTALAPAELRAYAGGLRGRGLTVIAVESCGPSRRSGPDAAARPIVSLGRMRELGLPIPQNVRYATAAERDLYERAAAAAR